MSIPQLAALGLIIAGLVVFVITRRNSAIGTEVTAPGNIGTEDQSPIPGGEPAELASVSVEELLRLVNEYRTGQGLQRIEKNDRFCELANSRAKMIAEDFSQKFVEENEDYLFRAVCLKCTKMGELISRNAEDIQRVVQNWIANPATKKTLDHPGYNIGCAGGYSPDQTRAFVALELGEKVRQ